jgi:uncharacterized membrane protein
LAKAIAEGDRGAVTEYCCVVGGLKMLKSKANLDLIFTALIMGAIVLGVIIYTFNAGSINRFIATVNQDKTTTKDVVYQANGVRVYYFVHDGDQCYMADDPQGGAGIFCLEKNHEQ